MHDHFRIIERRPEQAGKREDPGPSQGRPGRSFRPFSGTRYLQGGTRLLKSSAIPRIRPEIRHIARQAGGLAADGAAAAVLSDDDVGHRCGHSGHDLHTGRIHAFALRVLQDEPAGGIRADRADQRSAPSHAGQCRRLIDRVAADVQRDALGDTFARSVRVIRRPSGDTIHDSLPQAQDLGAGMISVCYIHFLSPWCRRPRHTAAVTTHCSCSRKLAATGRRAAPRRDAAQQTLFTARAPPCGGRRS